MRDPWMLTDQLLYRARLSGKREAVYDYDGGMRYTYDDLVRRSDRLAWFLTHHLGLKKGERIGFCANNCVPFIDAFYASCRTGIILTTYNCLLSRSDLLGMVERESPKVIFYSSRYRKTVDIIRESGLPVRLIPLDGIDAKEEYRYQDIMDLTPEGELPPTDLSTEDIEMLIHTGGTTGRPKAAMLSYRAILFNAISEILTLDLGAEDCAYVCLPFFHTAAWNVLTLPLLMTGGRLILAGEFHPETALRIIREERPTVSIAVETIYKAMADCPDFEKTDLSCYKWMLSGAAPISYQVMKQYWDRGVKLVNAYGMTEIGPNNLVPPVAGMTLDEVRAMGDTVGVPMYFNHVRVSDEEGNDVPDGVPGELLWRSPLTFSGYWEDPESTAEAITDGWVHSGDIGCRDEKGHYRICGRIKNMYISGGENIFPIEIEKMLLHHPAVAECCVIGVPDDRWGEVGKALIITKPGQSTTKEELMDFAKQELSSIKIPKYISFVENIPKNAVGKLDLASIKAQYGQKGAEAL